MRGLAQELGVVPMALYKHVANKEELLDGMVDIVFSEIELPSADLDWRSAMRRRAISTREALKRHSWAIGMMESRHPGPANLRNHNAVMGCLRECGLLVRDGDPRLLGPGRLHLRLRPAGKGSRGSRPPTVPEKPRSGGRRRSARSTTTRTSSRSLRSSPSPGTTTPSSSHGGSISSSTASSSFATPELRRHERPLPSRGPSRAKRQCAQPSRTILSAPVRARGSRRGWALPRWS